MENKLDKILDRMDAQGNRLTAIEADLKYHIQRSTKLEEIVAQHERYFWWAMGAISLAGPLVSKLLEGIAK